MAPKRVSLEAFLVAGAAILAEADVGLQIVGEVETAYLERLRRRFPSVEFVGPVPDVQSYMAGARLALVPDLLGGFKLKGLDYVFNRLPILAMREALRECRCAAGTALACSTVTGRLRMVSSP